MVQRCNKSCDEGMGEVAGFSLQTGVAAPVPEPKVNLSLLPVSPLIPTRSAGRLKLSKFVPTNLSRGLCTEQQTPRAADAPAYDLFSALEGWDPS